MQYFLVSEGVSSYLDTIATTAMRKNVFKRSNINDFKGLYQDRKILDIKSP